MSNRVEGVCIIQCNFAFWGMEYTLSTKQGETSQKTSVERWLGNLPRSVNFCCWIWKIKTIHEKVVLKLNKTLPQKVKGIESRHQGLKIFYQVVFISYYNSVRNATSFLIAHFAEKWYISKHIVSNGTSNQCISTLIVHMPWYKRDLWDALFFLILINCKMQQRPWPIFA